MISKTPLECAEELMEIGLWTEGSTRRVSELFRVIIQALHELEEIKYVAD